MADDERPTDHRTVEVGPGVRLHLTDSGGGDDGRPAVVLLHGFPQTGHEWHRVIPRLTDAGLRVITPDYRGAGGSSKPSSGYDKMTMAADIRSVLRTHLEVSGPVVLVGHDIGAMIAVAYAFRYPQEVALLVVVDAPIPGTKVFEQMRGDPRGWHAAFHGARDIAEALVHGRESIYLQHLIEVRIYDPSAIALSDLDTYVRAYQAPGAMRAGFELYRAFDQDGEALRAALAATGRLTVPTLAIAGEMSGLGGFLEATVRELADNVEFLAAPRSGHWIPEENPDFVADAILERLRGR